MESSTKDSMLDKLFLPGEPTCQENPQYVSLQRLVAQVQPSGAIYVPLLFRTAEKR